MGKERVEWKKDKEILCTNFKKVKLVDRNIEMDIKIYLNFQIKDRQGR